MTHAIELNRRGIESRQRGNWQEALTCYEQAIALEPTLAEAHFNLGLLCRDLGRVDQALRCFQRVADLRPDVLESRLELSQLYCSLKDFDRAKQECQSVLDAAPTLNGALQQLAHIHSEQSQWDEAERLLRQILASDPQNAEVWCQLGVVLHEQHRDTEAETAYRAAVQLDAGQAAALTNLGGLLRRQGRYDDALACQQQAVAANPQLADAHVNLGNTLRQLDRNAEAVQAYYRATQVEPNHTVAWQCLAGLLSEMGDTDQAGRVYAALGQRFPGDPFHQLRHVAACPLVFANPQELDEYKDRFLQVTRELEGATCGYPLEKLVQGPECPFNLQFLDGNLRPFKESFAAVYAAAFDEHNARFETWRPRGKPRIGIVAITRWSSSFLEPFGGFVQRLDPRFQVSVICRHDHVASIRQGLGRSDIEVVGVTDSIVGSAKTLRQLRFDLLYYMEVGNTAANYFLPFLRLAPVQVTSWGIQVTTGIPTVDAYISSEWIETEESDQHYCEKLICGKTMLAYRWPVRLPSTVPSRESFGFQGQQHLYGCVQNLGKFHPDFDPILGRILRADPRGTLVVGEDRTGIAIRRLKARFERTLPDVLHRIAFMPALKNADYLCLLSHLDVLLDPIHFGGVSTSYDALALAKPVVTLPSGFQRGNYTSGLLRKLGLTETIARDADDYVRIAIELGGSAERRAAISAQIIERRGDAFEVEAVVGEHEEIFERLIDEAHR